MSYELIEEKLYDYTSGSFCGVLVPEHVMKKLTKLQAKHLEEVKKVLTEHKAELYPSMWTLYYPDGVQTVVNFAEISDDVDRRIQNAVHSHTPKYLKTVYKAATMDDARNQAQSRFDSTGLVD